MKWDSYHIFYHNYEKHDELINIIDDYMIKVNEKQWFFIRYWDGGPHIRFRVKSGFETKKLFVNVEAFIKRNLTQIKIDKDKFYKSSLKYRNSGDDGTQWYEEGDIKIIDYIPEYERYGGKELMELTEKLFISSSKLSCYLIKKHRNFSVKLLLVKALISILLESIFEKCVSSKKNYKSTLRDYMNFWDFKDSIEINRFWRNNVESLSKIKGSLNMDYKIGEFLQEMIAGFEKIQAYLQNERYFASILLSHIHMFCNRMGIAPLYEISILRDSLVL
ncbi:thiopeptide-type bacteriocin biosynthesis protein [Streptococcus sp. H31]|uniref:thiopeptide-type bacteriocin biosynthesis protein n=1 Tax=Streptococcus huangxiaojuni TaxID=3237239 RepID=UPI0034A235DE